MPRPALPLALALSLSLAAPVARAADCSSNLLVVLDRSCSMQTEIKDPQTGVTATKWATAVAALSKLANKYKDLRYGLTMFPDAKVVGPVCAQGALPLACGVGNAAKLVNLLGMTQPNGPCVTNIDEAMKQAQGDPALKDGTRRSFVLLLTDGEQSANCNGGTATADPKTVQYITALNKLKVPTYVVGFAAAASAKSLNAFADAGGVPSKGDPATRFYLANNATELDKVLDSIGAGAAASEFGCTGLPCPDGRCLAAGEQCVQGRCVAPVVDMTGGGGGGGADGGGGSEVSSGCNCQSAPGGASLGNGALILAALASLRRRRRRVKAS